MKQFLAVAALDETAVKQNEMLKNSHIYTEGFTVLRHEHMEFSVLVDGELYNQRSLHEELQKAGFPKPAGLEETVLYAYLLWGEKAMLHMDQQPNTDAAGRREKKSSAGSQWYIGAICLWSQHQRGLHVV